MLFEESMVIPLVIFTSKPRSHNSLKYPDKQLSVSILLLNDLYSRVWLP